MQLSTKNAHDPLSEHAQTVFSYTTLSPSLYFTPCILIVLCSVTVSYVRRTGQHRWRCADVTFRCTNQELCDQWIHILSEQLSLLSKSAL